MATGFQSRTRIANRRRRESATHHLPPRPKGKGTVGRGGDRAHVISSGGRRPGHAARPPFPPQRTPTGEFP